MGICSLSRLAPFGVLVEQSTSGIAFELGLLRLFGEYWLVEAPLTGGEEDDDEEDEEMIELGESVIEAGMSSPGKVATDAPRVLWLLVDPVDTESNTGPFSEPLLV